MTERRLTSALGTFRSSHEQQLVLAAAGLVVLIAGALPLASVMVGARVDADDEHLLLRVLGGFAAHFRLLGWSAALAAVVTAFSLAIGVPLAVALAKTDLPCRSALLAVHAFPMFLPPYLLALGWFYVFGRNGTFGSEAGSAILFGPIGAIAVMSIAFTPIATVLGYLGLRGVDPELEEAARLTARPRTVLSRITLPAVWPALALAAAVIFTLAFSELGVPMFLRVRTYPAAVLARLGGASYTPGEAAFLVLPLLLVAVVLVQAERFFTDQRSFAVLGVQREHPEWITLGRGRIAVAAAAWSVVLAGLVPLAGLLVTASTVDLATLPRWMGDSLRNSVTTAAIAALVMGLVGVAIGHAVARNVRFARAIETLTVLTFVTPAPLLAVGLISVWNRPGAQAVYTTSAIVVIGYVARYSVVAVRTMAAALAQVPTSMEDSAAMVGASYVTRMRRIVLPLSRRGLALAVLLAIVFCLRDLETAVMYYPAGREPLPVRIMTLEANGPEPVVAALALVHVLVTAVVVVFGGVLVVRR
jgi:iron(III) transport system permease protein